MLDSSGGPNIGVMSLEDAALPAAAALSGPHAVEVLEPAVGEFGGVLHAARCVGLHYVPGRELLGRYDCDISWPAGRSRDTLLASTTTKGALPGTIAVTASTPTATLEVGVWRWPFDPVVGGLTIAVTPAVLAGHLHDVTGGGRLRVEVVAYRPTERAVVRVVDEDDRTWYLKTLPPALVGPIVERHEALRSAGVLVPRVLHADETNGLLLLESMAGVTLRDRIKSGHGAWPEPGAIGLVLDTIGGAFGSCPPAPRRAARTRDAMAHTGLLATIVPEAADLLTELRRRFVVALDAVAARSGTVIHGDLHESQLFVDVEGNITGLIDLDDLGPGDPLDDPATLLGHLEYRAITGGPATEAAMRPRLGELREHFGAIHGAGDLDLAVAAVLVGLATGPFRAQAHDWRRWTHDVLVAASCHAGIDRSPVRELS